MLNATMGKKIRGASAGKCKSVPMYEFWAQNKNPHRLDFELLLGKSNLRESFGPLCGCYLVRYSKVIFIRLRYLVRYLRASSEKILRHLVRYLRVKTTEQAHLLKCPCFA